MLLQVLLSEMRQAGIAPDAATYGRMISAFADARQPKKAAAVMQQVIDGGTVVSLLHSPHTHELVHHKTPGCSSTHLAEPAEPV